MSNINVSIRYGLSETGRKLSLTTGGTGKREQTVTGAIEVADIDLFRVDDDGSVSAYLNQDFDTPQTVDTLVAYMRERQREAALKEQQNKIAIEQAIEKFMASPDMRGEIGYSSVCLFRVYDSPTKQEIEVPLSHPAAQEAIRREQEDRKTITEKFLSNPNAYASERDIDRGTIDREKRIGDKTIHYSFYKDTDLFKEAKRRHEQKLAQKEEAERLAREEKFREEMAKSTYLAQWVGEFGSDNQRSRYAAGMLPASEIKEELKRAAFAKLDEVYSVFRKITLSEFCECDYPNEDKIDCSNETAASATAEEWEQFNAMKTLMPEATITIKNHECGCKRCEESLTRTGFLVVIPVGPFNFAKEYGLSENK